MAEETGSKMLDYLVNGGDELAAVQAREEYALGWLEREIADNARLREVNAELLEALRLIVDGNSPGTIRDVAAIAVAAIAKAGGGNG